MHERALRGSPMPITRQSLLLVTISVSRQNQACQTFNQRDSWKKLTSPDASPQLRLSA